MEGPEMDKGVRGLEAGADGGAADDRPKPLTTEERPWGRSTVLVEGPRYTIERLEMSPGQRMSIQMHYHRSEHWVVVAGTARVRVGDREVYLHPNQSAFVPPATPHRVENPGSVPLVLIEIRTGEYLQEDDLAHAQEPQWRAPSAPEGPEVAAAAGYVERKAYGGSRLVRRPSNPGMGEGSGRGSGDRPRLLP
jgi:mannose-6-phosphate isomerase